MWGLTDSQLKLHHSALTSSILLFCFVFPTPEVLQRTHTFLALDRRKLLLWSSPSPQTGHGIHPSIYPYIITTYMNFSPTLCDCLSLHFSYEIIYIQGNCKSILEDNDCWVAWWFTPQLLSLSCEEETYFACLSKGPNSFQQNGDRRAGLNFEHSK